LSDDRRFATAYNAVLQLAKMAIACAGYRVTGTAHHLTTFQALPLAMNAGVKPLAIYFDLCRRKRNALDYELAYVATEVEASEILEKAREFRHLVEAWIATEYPTLAAGQ
jgi:hypothetical protein